MNMNFQKLDRIVDTFPGNTILCVGDMMLDEYISGPADRLSPEAPVPVIRRQNVRQVLGGVGNVAANLADLKCETLCFYAVAQDHEAEQVKQMLSNHGVHAYPFTAGLMTTKKQRIIAQKQQICRIDSEEPLNLSKQQEDMIIHHVISLMPRVTTILLSDYNKGLITSRIAQAIIQEAQNTNKAVFVDPKGNDYSKYTGATLIKPNFNELKMALRQIAPETQGIENLDPRKTKDIEKIKEMTTLLRKKLNIPNAVVTLGEHGMLLSTEQDNTLRPTTARAVSDVSGAGDTSLAVLGAAYVSDPTLVHAVNLANIGAGIVVGKEGTATISHQELKTTLRNMFNNEPSTFWAKTFGFDRR